MRIALVAAALLILGALCYATYQVPRMPHALERGATTRAAHSANDSRTADPTTPVRPKDVPVSQPVPRTLKQQFLEATNLADFVARAAPTASEDDGQAALYIAKAYEECMPFGKDPNAYVTTLREILKPHLRSTSDAETFDKLMEQKVSRCAVLNEGDHRQKAMQDWLRKGAAQGSLLARIVALSTGVNEAAPDEIRDILAQLVRSKDGEAISDIGPLMALMPADELTAFKDFAGVQDSAYVWRLAGCSFGADCSRSGDILRGMCESAGLCSFNSLEEAYSRILPPIEFEQVIKMRDALIIALKKGE